MMINSAFLLVVLLVAFWSALVHALDNDQHAVEVNDSAKHRSLQTVFYHNAFRDSAYITGTTKQSYSEATIGGDMKGLYYGHFQTHRWGSSPFYYTITDPEFEPGSWYMIRLGFAETYTKHCFPGRRLMDIKVNGASFVNNLDVYGEAGCEAALVKEKAFLLDESGKFAIEFASSVQNPMVSIISIAKTTAPTATTTIDCTSKNEEMQSLLDLATAQDNQSLCLADSLGIFFQNAYRDNEYIYGNIRRSMTDKPIGGDTKGFFPEYFQSHIWGIGSFHYSISDPSFQSGSMYTIRLGFAETFSDACADGKRIMNIDVNGAEFAYDLDVFQKVGCETALIVEKEFILDESNTFNIVFESTVQNPMVSLIEISENAPDLTTCTSVTDEMQDLLDLAKAQSDLSLCLVETTEAPAPGPTPIPPLEPVTCEPTSGTCATTKQELLSLLGSANERGTVAICDGSVIDMGGPQTVTTAYLTLCCAGANCVLQNLSLLVLGDSFTIKGIHFTEGRDSNLSITAPGEHQIINCGFTNGKASNHGGNVEVTSRGPSTPFGYGPFESSLVIDGSYFVGGDSYEGGGLYVGEIDVATITNSIFARNNAWFGGGLTFSLCRQIVVEDCTFDSNTASNGGGGIYNYHQSSFEEVVSLSILNSFFQDNSNGAGGISGPSSFKAFEMIFSGNSGAGNTFSRNGCAGFDLRVFQEDGTTTVCPAVDEEFTY